MKLIFQFGKKWALSWFVLFSLVRFWPMLLGKTLIFGDNYSLMVPGKIFTAFWLKQNILPLWNPYILAGLPWAGDVNQSVFYPSTLLFAIFHPAIALNLTVVLNLFVSWMGMMFLSLKVFKKQNIAIVSSILWVFSTQLTGSINNLSTVQSLVWLPWIVGLGLLLTEKKATRFYFSLAVFFQFAGGYPQHVVYAILASVLFSLFFVKKNGWFKWLTSWLQTACWTVMLSALIWLPFADLLLKSTRMLQTVEQAGVGSLDPVMTLKMVLPYIFDNPSLGIKWGPAWSGQPNMVFYLTWLGLLMIAIKLKNWQQRTKLDAFFIGFTVISLVFSLGSNLPGFQLIQNLIPFFKIGRYPSMVLILTSLFLSLYVAQLIFLTKLPKLTRFWGMMLGLSLVAIGLLWLFSRWQFDQIWLVADNLVSNRLTASNFHNLVRDQAIAQMISQNLLFNFVFFIIAIFSLLRKKTKLLILVIGLDLVFNTQGNFFFAPQDIYPSWSQINLEQGQVMGQQLGFQSRLLTRNSNVPYTDFGSYWEAMVVRAPFSDSFVDKQELQDFNHAINLRQGLTLDWNITKSVPTVHGYTTLLPQDYASIWQKSDQTRINFIDQVKIDDPALADWAVGYYLVDSWFKLETDDLPQPLLKQDGRFRLYQLPAKPRFRDENDQALELNNFQETPNSLKFEVKTQENSHYLIVADRYDSDIVAEVDGHKVEVINDQGKRKIELQPGIHQIKFSYQPQLLYLGAMISLITLVMGVVWLKFSDQTD